MPLLAGTKLGPYEILGPIGAGGMGEVYRARDTRLERIVAVKISKEHFTERFEREARTVALLNHPHICQIYDVGPNYLVMEYIEGTPLRGPLPVNLALQYGAQICDALDAAHKKGVIHRDLKPTNILITKTGIKLLDFGLAKVEQAASSQDGATQTLTLTGQHEIVGTLYYMSPEQLQAQGTGQPIDARSDIFSFGLVLYEMLTGKRAFEGASAVSVIAAIIERPAPSIANVAPPALDRLLQRCLKKDPDERWQSARDLKAELEWIAEAPGEVASLADTRYRWLPWIAGFAVLTVVALFVWIRTSRPEASAPSDLSFVIPPPPGKDLAPVGGLSVDEISPDGSMVLFRAGGRFYLRRLNSFESEALPEFTWYGTPFWFPDSRSIAFPAVGGLMKVRIPKGALDPIAKEMSCGRGGSWGEKGIILCAKAGAGLFSVSAAGGIEVPVEVSGLKEGRYYNPEFLPGGEDFLFEFVAADSEETQVYVATFRDGKAVNPRFLFSNETAAAFTPAGGGRILFVRNDNLYSQKFDLNAHKLLGDPELIQERVASMAGFRDAYFSASRTGTIVWRSGTTVVSQVTVFDRTGRRLGIAGASAAVAIIRLSPDESRVIALGEAGSWILDAHGPGRVGNSRGGFWSPDGSRLIFVNGKKLVEYPVRDSGQLRELAEIPVERSFSLHDISADGRRILFGQPAGLFVFTLGGG